MNERETEIRLRKFYSETGQAALVFTHERTQKQYQLQVKRYMYEEMSRLNTHAHMRSHKHTCAFIHFTHTQVLNLHIYILIKTTLSMAISDYIPEELTNFPQCNSPIQIYSYIYFLIHAHTHTLHLYIVRILDKDFDPLKLFNEHLKIFINNHQEQKTKQTNSNNPSFVFLHLGPQHQCFNNWNEWSRK